MRRSVAAAPADRVALLCASVAVVTMCGGAAVAGASPGHAVAATRAAPVARTVLLPTGDRVLLRQDAGAARVSLLPGGPSAGRVQTLGLGASQYVMPAAATFYAGRLLDRGLFDVTRLATVESDGRVPVRLSFPAGSARDVPGVTVTARSGSTATGYLTARSGRAFDAALVAQWRHDAVPGAARPSTLLGASQIALDAPAVASVRPDYPQVTLVMHVLDEHGAPLDSGVVILVDTDDLRKYDAVLSVAAGVARASVPLGHYSAWVDVSRLVGSTPVDYFVTRTDITVDRNLQSLTFDARTATASPTVTVPTRPTSETDESVVWSRADRRHLDTSVEYYLPPGAKLFVAPAPAARIGHLNWVANWVLLGPPSGVASYRYNLSFDQEHGILADQHYRVAEGGLATIHDTFFADVPARHAAFAVGPVHRDVLPEESFYGQATPQQLTDYVTPGRWRSELVGNFDFDRFIFAGEVDDGVRTYQPGQLSAADWVRGPLAPGVRVRTGGEPAGFACPVCRRSGKLSIDLAAVTDTVPGHAGYLELDPFSDGTNVERFRLYRDGKLVSDQPDVNGGEFAVPAGKATYRIIDSVNRAPGGFVGSTHSTVDDTFVSSAASGGRLPAGWTCSATGKGACRILPLLQVRVPLPESLTDRLPVGTSTVAFTVDHVQGAAASAIRSAGLATSTDGKTWTAAPVKALGHGRFSAVVHNTTPGAGVSLRTTATDAAGGSLTQTTTNAYFVAGSSR